MKDKLTAIDTKLFSEDLLSHPESNIARHTVVKNGIFKSSVDETLEREMKNSFSVVIDTGAVCNQKQSGRCWMFAGLNVLRQILAKNLNTKSIELSQSYLQFYDKLEKANFLLEKALEYSNEPIDSRNNVFLLDSAIQDGGHFAMFTNLVKKYGVVPLEEMPDLAVSTATGELNKVLTEYLNQAILELREAKKKKARKPVLMRMKEGYLNDVYRILTICIGKPVEEFTYEYEDKDKKHVTLEKMTPLNFYEKYIKVDLDDYICLCDAPISNHEEYQKYTCKLVNNVIGGDDVVFFNVPLNKLKEASIKSLEGGEPIWFGADVLAQSLRKEGILADGILRTDTLFSLKPKMTKGERLEYRTSFCNHAMTFTGVNLVEGTPNRWKVENSWGKDNGKDGYYIMSDEWFDEYVYEVFISRKYIDPEILAKYDASKPIEEEPFNALWKYEN